MLDKINNICKIEYTAVHQVIDFTYLPGELIHLDTVWSTLDFVPNAQLGIDKRDGKAGRSFECEFSCGLRAKFLKPGSFIFRLTLSDGSDPMIIGSTDLPVRLEESHNLTSKRLTFSHRSWHYPYRVPVGYGLDSGSGSGSGGV